MKVKRILSYSICFLMFSAFTTNESVWETKFLFHINCEYADMIHDLRPDVEIAIAHDSLIIFPSYKDTILFFNLSGKIVKKIHHTMGSYPLKIEYNNTKNVLYCLTSTLNTQAHQIIVLNLDGIIQKTYTVNKDYLRTWLRIAGYSRKSISDICSSVIAYNKYCRINNSINNLKALLSYRGILNKNKVMFNRSAFFISDMIYTNKVYNINEKKLSDLKCVANFSYPHVIQYEKKICDTTFRMSNFNKVRRAFASSPFKSKNKIITIHEWMYVFYFLVTEPPIDNCID